MRRATRLPGLTAGLRGASAALFLLGLSGCHEIETIREHFQADSPHEAYAHSLSVAGLTATALGRDWLHVAERALSESHAIRLPYRETGWLAPERPSAIGYRWTARRGQRVTIEFALAADDSALVFLDLYRLFEDSARAPRRVVSADSGFTRIEYEPRGNADYVLRIQPELLRGGRYTITITGTASLAFPVSGGGSQDIGSPFGADRDGGRRRHHGIDIFAPRGTPVVAAAPGIVSRVADTPIGGKVVWLRDEARGQSLYYAHLDRQAVEPGVRVAIGDTLGFVGNTGNARTTPPHLHFGIYRRGEGPVDPYPFVHRSNTRPPRLTADTTFVGRWSRTARDAVPVRLSAHDRAPQLRELPRHTTLRVEAASGAWFRVRLPDGAAGFVPGHLTEVLDHPIGSERLAVAMPVRSRPAPSAAPVDSVAAGIAMPVFGRFGEYLFVRAPSGRDGWLDLE